MNCNICKDTGKVLLLYSHVDCECVSNSHPYRKYAYKPENLKTYFKRIEVEANSYGTAIFENEMYPKAIYCVSIEKWDPMSSLRIELFSIHVGLKAQAINPSYIKLNLYAPNPVEWDRVSSDNKLALVYYNKHKEDVSIYTCIWGVPSV